MRVPALRYAGSAKAGSTADTGELAHLRLRYKRPGENTSRLIETPILRSQVVAAPSAQLRFASAVAAFADTLRGGKQIGQWSWNDIASAAQRSIGSDQWGQRREFIGLVEQARRLTATEGVASAQVSE